MEDKKNRRLLICIGLLKITDTYENTEEAMDLEMEGERGGEDEEERELGNLQWGRIMHCV